MGRVGEASSWGKSAENNKDGIPEGIVWRVFVPVAAPEVLAIGIQRSVAVVTFVAQQVW